MDGFTYDTLVTALEDWPEARADEYIAQIPTMVFLGETKLLRDLNLELFDVTDTGVATVTDDRLVAKPDGWIATRHLFLVTDDATGAKQRLIFRSSGWVEMYAPDPSVQGVPKYFTEYDEDQWLIVPTPNDDYTIEAKIIKRPPGLSPTNQNTWLGDNAADLLFFACLQSSERFLKADDRYADMVEDYNDRLQIARIELRRSIRSGDYSPYRGAAKEAG